MTNVYPPTWAILRARLSGSERPRLDERSGPPNFSGKGSAAPRAAAVAIVLAGPERPEDVLLIRRADNPQDPWSGQMAFPGGRMEAMDASLLETAIREVREEVGLALQKEEAIGQLPDLPAVARGRPVDFWIRPFVFSVYAKRSLEPRSAEASEVMWCPLRPLLDGRRSVTYRDLRVPQSPALPGFDVGGRIVWGLTQRMLAQVLVFLAAGDRPSDTLNRGN